MTPNVRRWLDRGFYLAFAAFTACAVVFVVAGATPFVARVSPSVAMALSGWAAGEGPLAATAGRAVEAMGWSRGEAVPPNLLVVLEFAFSALNIGLGILLVRLRPRLLTARLLALGMVGTGAVFNAQAHAARVVLPDFGTFTHDNFHYIGGLTYLYAIALFPDGRLKPPWRELPRWRWPLRVAYLVALPIAGVFVVDEIHGGDPAAMILLFGIMIPVVGLSAQVGRYRHAETADERRQSRLLITTLTSAVGGAVTFGILAGLLSGQGDTAELGQLVFRVFPALFAAIPVSLCVILIRFRLWDLDRLLNRTFVFGALASFIGVVYVGVVVSGSHLLAGRGGDRSLALAVVATAIIAVAFDPLRARLTSLANRLVYGHRETPYQVLSRFSDRVGETYAVDDVLPRMARLLAEGTAARRADVWLAVRGELVRAASWPQTAERVDVRVPLDGGDRSRRRGGLPPLPDVHRTVAVTRHGELLGALTVAEREGESLTPAEEQLLGDLAAQAGLVLGNVQLTEELRDQVETLSRQTADLRASRQRIVAAQDAERRRMERDIHDGSQQHLVALAVKLRLARSLIDRSPERVGPLVDELRGEAAEALELLRNLARGIYPAVLADQGLVEALRSQAARAPVTTHIEADNVRRYPPPVETAVYFCCLEALQNAVKHAHASAVTIHLSEDHGVLSFTVADDGTGFDGQRVTPGHGLQNLADRLASLGGTVELRSRPGSGTTLTGRVRAAPASVPEPVT
ncbi:MAG: sensor histidine kinase [Actinomycetota bacterium]|nr:sensor histidine kinase [Actinomycetota bacterium]